MRVRCARPHLLYPRPRAGLSWSAWADLEQPAPLPPGLGLLQALRGEMAAAAVQPLPLPAAPSQGLALLKQQQQQQERWGGMPGPGPLARVLRHLLHSAPEPVPWES